MTNTTDSNLTTKAAHGSKEDSTPCPGSAQTLPEDWICDRCGKTAAEAAVIHPRSEMTADERATLDEYGEDEGQFFYGEAVELCGQCGSSHWSAPNEKAEAHPQPQKTSNERATKQ